MQFDEKLCKTELPWLSKYAYSIIKDTKLESWVSENDLINDAIITMSELGKKYSPTLFKKLITAAYFNYINDGRLITSLYNPRLDEKALLPNESYCKGCNDFLNINAFKIRIDKKSGCSYVGKSCRECENKRERELYKLKNKKP